MKIKLFTIVIAVSLGFFAVSDIAGAQIFTNPSASTSAATSIGNTYATLNGYVSSNGGIGVSSWFEWSTNVYYFNKTSQTNYGATTGTIYNYYLGGLSPNTTYYYRAVAQNVNGGIAYGNIITFTTINNPSDPCPYYYYNSICAPVATTTIATNIEQSSTRLNGYGLMSNGLYNTTGYFEYGANEMLGNTTAVKTIGGTKSNYFYEDLSNLASDTTYYYRAVVTNQYGISRGNTVSFRTKSMANTPAATYKNTPAVKTSNSAATTGSSLVSLEISQNSGMINKGSIIEYKIDYKNTSAKNLKDVILKILIPGELDFIETSRGYFSEESNAILANIDNLDSKETGNVRVRVKATANAETGKIAMITANLVYTVTSSNAQGESFAYTKNTVADGIVVQQAAAAFLFGENFLPSTLLGWLLLLVLIVLLILALRKAYYGPKLATIPASSKKSH